MPMIKCCSGPAASEIRLTELQNRFVQSFNVVFIIILSPKFESEKTKDEQKMQMATLL